MLSKYRKISEQLTRKDMTYSRTLYTVCYIREEIQEKRQSLQDS